MVTEIGVDHLQVSVFQWLQTVPVVVTPADDGYKPEYQPGVLAPQCPMGTGQLANNEPDPSINLVHVALGNKISSHEVPTSSL